MVYTHTDHDSLVLCWGVCLSPHGGLHWGGHWSTVKSQSQLFSSMLELIVSLFLSLSLSHTHTHTHPPHTNIPHRAVNDGGLEMLYEIMLETSQPEVAAVLKIITKALEHQQPVMFFCKV